MTTVRQTTTILFLLFFCNVYGQKWELHRIDKSKKFKFEYWFQFDNLDDTSTYNFEKTSGHLKSTIHLTNNKGDTVSFAVIKIKGLDNDTLLNVISDNDGLGTVNLRPGKYQIEITEINFDKFSLDFTISEGEYFDLKIKLGLGPDLEVYQINSRTNLKEHEIFSIMNCVKENQKVYYKKCIEKKRYYINMHI
jgi:hypothetical protein